MTDVNIYKLVSAAKSLQGGPDAAAEDGTVVDCTAEDGSAEDGAAELSKKGERYSGIT